MKGRHSVHLKRLRDTGRIRSEKVISNYKPTIHELMQSLSCQFSLMSLLFGEKMAVFVLGEGWEVII